tara:strand:+ start:243 stop:428 length:186 start_codon:yes stop_codon:yes gene_type:complete
MKNKFFEYMTIFFAIVGTLSMVAAVGAIEEDKWMLGASAISLGIASFIMSLFSQSVFADNK